MFNRMPRKTIPTFGGRKQSVVTSMVGKMFEDMLDVKFTVEDGRRVGFYPSSFPICSILVYRKLVEAAHRDGKFQEERSAFSDFFAGLGTAAHESVQFYAGFSGRMFGDWKCVNARTCGRAKRALDLVDATGKVVRKGRLTARNTTKHRCPECNEPMAYVEKRLFYKGMSGRIDGLIKVGPRTFWVVDYKGATTKKIERGDNITKKSNLRQIKSYCYILEKKHGFKIKGFSLIYISRDNPKAFYEYSEEFNSKSYESAKEIFHSERRKYKAAVDSFRAFSPEIAIANKPCLSRKHYDDEISYYNPCPMLDICFDAKALRKELDKFTRDRPSDPEVRAKLIETVQLTDVRRKR